MQFKPVLMIGGAVLLLTAFEPLTITMKLAYGFVGAACGAALADPLEAEAKNLGLQMKAMKQSLSQQTAVAEA